MGPQALRCLTAKMTNGDFISSKINILRCEILSLKFEPYGDK